ncbi:MAG TPA: hypothetical protein VHO46_02265 [Bacteroidales bacterium]|nr:hypothetical protein [Bacteroidales bacterium]
MLRLTAFILSTLFLASSCGMIRNKMTVTTFNRVDIKNDKIHYSPIEWSLDTINGKIRKSAMYIPVRIMGDERNLKMQLDLGANSSVLYMKTINALGVDNPSLLKNVSVNKGRYSYSNTGIIINDGTCLYADRIPALAAMGDSTLAEASATIGTLGYDIIGDNVLLIDFINDSIAITGKLPVEIERMATFIRNPDLKKFPVILPFKMGNKKLRLFYDTGSSSFQILTGTKRLKKVSVNREIEVADSASSWGRTIYLYKAENPKIKGNLFIDKYDLGKIDIIGTDNLNPLSLAGKYIFGITGNEIFRNSILIIDRKNNRFGIIRNNYSKTESGSEHTR